MEDNTKYKIISLIESGHEAKDIADDLDVSYSAVLRIRKEFKEAKLNGDVAKLVDVDKLLIQQAADQLAIPEHNVEEVTKGLSGLEVLSNDLQATASALNNKIRTLVVQAEHPSELQVYADILCNLQTSFVNKNMTQVNVQNNFGGENQGSRYSQFLGDKPGG